MYIWMRALKAAVVAHFRQGLAAGETASAVTGRIWPQDLDMNLHVNNGRYLTLMDLGRIDFMFRSGIGQSAMKKRWRPMLTGLSVRFHHPLGLFYKYRQETVLVGWSERSLFLEQRFIPLGGPHAGSIAVMAAVRAVVLKPDDSKVEAGELLERLALPPQSPPLPESCNSLLSPEERVRYGNRAAVSKEDMRG